MGVREGTCLHFKAVIPISPPQALHEVSRRGEQPRLPLFENMAILVQHEPWVLEEFASAAAEVNATPAGGSDGAHMETCKQRVLDDSHALEALTEDLFEAGRNRGGQSD
jgi:hypothetical protein